MNLSDKLKSDDEIVSTTIYKDTIVIITKYGDLFSLFKYEGKFYFRDIELIENKN